MPNLSILVSVILPILNLSTGLSTPTVDTFWAPKEEVVAQSDEYSLGGLTATPPVQHFPVNADKPAPKITKTITVQASAYTSEVAQTDASPFTTASGSQTRRGVIAMNGVPFGTLIRIPQYFGNEVFVVEDRMNARYSTNHVDIWMEHLNDAKQWGRRTVKVEIIDQA